MKPSIQYGMTPISRADILDLKVFLRGVHPPDKICARCKAECGPRMDAGHDKLCDACAAMPADKVDYQARVYSSPVGEHFIHAIDCDMDEDCTCR